jgi:hypothetical protein
MEKGLTRRTLMGLFGARAAYALAQGVSSRGVKAQARGKLSGLPFNAHFVDIAAEAGLHAPVIYGGLTRKKYIIETVGCGCAFLDYDNDGWLDIFLLSGSRLEGPPAGAINSVCNSGACSVTCTSCCAVPTFRCASNCDRVRGQVDPATNEFVESLLAKGNLIAAGDDRDRIVDAGIVRREVLSNAKDTALASCVYIANYSESRTRAACRTSE